MPSRLWRSSTSASLQASFSPATILVVVTWLAVILVAGLTVALPPGTAQAVGVTRARADTHALASSSTARFPVLDAASANSGNARV